MLGLHGYPSKLSWKLLSVHDLRGLIIIVDIYAC